MRASPQHGSPPHRGTSRARARVSLPRRPAPAHRAAPRRSQHEPHGHASELLRAAAPSALGHAAPCKSWGPSHLPTPSARCLSSQRPGQLPWIPAHGTFWLCRPHTFPYSGPAGLPRARPPSPATQAQLTVFSPPLLGLMLQ